MKRLLLSSIVAALTLSAQSAVAWQRGDSAILCGQLRGFMWMGWEHHPCYVEILEVAGSSARVLSHNYCVSGKYHDSINRNRTAWVRTYALESSERSCPAYK